MRDGDLPLWNPLSATGTPFVATLQAAVFYPVNLLTLPLPFATTFVASALLRLWIAGFATYLLLRRYEASRIAGLLGGTAFMLSGFIVSWLGHPHTNVAIWLPALILGVEGLATSAHRQETMRWWSILAIVTGIQFLGGHIETSRDILFAASLYTLIRLTQLSSLSVRGQARKLLLTALAVAGGAGIAAIQLLPFLEWLPLSAEYQSRSSAGFQIWNFDPENLLALPLAVMPNLYGNPTWDGAYWSFNPWGSFNESVLYAGTVPLALAIGALATWRNDPIVRAWTIIGGLTLGVALRLPVFDWLNQLPGFALGHPGRLRLVTIFAVALLSGIGLDALRSRRRAALPRKLLTFSLASALGVVSAVLLLFNLILPRMSDWKVRAVSRIVDHFSESPSPPRTVLICRERIDACGDELGQAFALSNWEMYLTLPVAALALAVIWASGRNAQASKRLAPALLALTVVELAAIGWGYNPAVNDDPLTEMPPALAAAADVAGEGRLTVLQQDALPDSHMLYGFQDIRGLDFKSEWYETYLNESGDRIPWIANGVLLDGAGPLVTALDVQAILTANPHLVERLTSDGSMLTAATVDGFTVLIPAGPMQRATLRYDLVLVESDQEAAALLAEGPERALTGAILPDSEAARHAAEVIDAESGDGSATVTRAEPEHLVIEVETSEPGLLVVSDAYYPGWTATVDGAPADILRANTAFRAVLVEAGSHRVEMRYEPDSVRYGMIASAIAIALVSAVFALSYIAPRR